MHIAIDSASFAYGKRAQPAVDGLRCTIGPGITGIVGPNGAGKTTLFRLLLGTLAPQSGSIRIDERTPDDFRRGGRLAFIPDKSVFPAQQSIQSFVAGLNMLAATAVPLPPRLVPLAERRLDSLSLGEARLVELFVATMGDPLVLLLDEPTNGLDPHAVIHLRDQLKMLNDGTRIIVIASHHLDELQRLANAVLVLDHGRLVGTVDDPNGIVAGQSLESAFHALTKPVVS